MYPYLYCVFRHNQQHLPQSLGVLEYRIEGSVSRMEGNCASIWSEESEMIAHLQSMFWSSSNADSCLSSPDSSTSSCVEPSTLPTTLFLPLDENDCCDKEQVQCQNTGVVWCFDHQSQVFAPIFSGVTSNKRACLMENKKSKNSKKPRTIALVSEVWFCTLTFMTLCVVEEKKAVLTLWCNFCRHQGQVQLLLLMRLTLSLSIRAFPWAAALKMIQLVRVKNQLF